MEVERCDEVTDEPQDAVRCRPIAQQVDEMLGIEHVARHEATGFRCQWLPYVSGCSGNAPLNRSNPSTIAAFSVIRVRASLTVSDWLAPEMSIARRSNSMSMRSCFRARKPGRLGRPGRPRVFVRSPRPRPAPALVMKRSYVYLISI